MGKNILILTYWSYPDALIQTYTLPYVRIIRKNLPPGSLIHLVTLEKDKSVLEKSNLNPVVKLLREEDICWIPLIYRPFGPSAFLLWLGALLKLGVLIVQRKVSSIHCWCTPSGAIGYFLSIFFNRKLVLDSYEPHAETMVENGTWKKESLAFRLLFWLEKKQTERADVVISATAGMRDYARRKYGVLIENFHVKPACVDLDLFGDEAVNDLQLRDRLGLNNKIVCVYAGKFGGIYLEDEVFDFIKVATVYWGDTFRFLILTSHSLQEISSYCSRAEVNPASIVVRFVPHHEVPRYLGLGDFALTPVKAIPTKRYCTPIKDGEYWALGLPIVIPPNISDDSDIVEENSIGAVLSTFSKQAYFEAIVKIDRLRSQPGLRAKIRSIAYKYRSFAIAEQVYKKVYYEGEFHFK